MIRARLCTSTITTSTCSLRRNWRSHSRELRSRKDPHVAGLDWVTRIVLVARGGVEPPTFRFSVGRSYQLSYLAEAEHRALWVCAR